MQFDPRKPPKRYQKFGDEFPALFEAYQALGEKLREAGPLKPREVRLCKLSMALGANLRGAVFAHTGLALEEGIQPEEIRHAAVLALSTLGLPRMMAALAWVDEVLESRIQDQDKA